MKDISAVIPDLKLKFNIEHPNLDECYLYGYECARAEVEETENPFTEGSSEYYQWSEGWWDGFYGEEPLFAYDQLPEEPQQAANDHSYHLHLSPRFIATFLKITGALAATAVVGYQFLDLVA